MNKLRFLFRAHAALVAANRNMMNMFMLYLQLAANMHWRRQRRIFARAWIMELPSWLYETLLGDLERCDQAASRDFTRCAPEL